MQIMPSVKTGLGQGHESVGPPEMRIDLSPKISERDCGRSVWLRQKLARIDTQAFGNFPQRSDAGRNGSPFDIPDVSHAQAGAVGQFFLRHLLAMAYSTQVHRHDLLEIHSMSGTSIGTIVPGTIVPIQPAMC